MTTDQILITIVLTLAGGMIGTAVGFLLTRPRPVTLNFNPPQNPDESFIRWKRGVL